MTTNATTAPTAPPTAEWTAATIYKPGGHGWGYNTMPPLLEPERIHSEQSRDRWGKRMNCLFSDAFLDVLATETQWEWIEDAQTLPRDIAAKVGNGEMPCPICKRSEMQGTFVDRRVRGMDTGIEGAMLSPCPCRVHRMFRSEWRKAMGPHKRFDAVRLRTLLPDASVSFLPVERQAEIITFLRSKPTASYLLQGPPGTGKTHFLTALYAHALSLWAWKQSERRSAELSVWRVSAASLLDEHVAWATRSALPEGAVATPPSVTPNMIRAVASRGLRPCRFIDELDKIAPTDFKLKTLVEIIDAVYSAEGQIVATTNKGLDQLSAKWGSDEAGTALRRIGVERDAYTILFASPETEAAQ